MTTPLISDAISSDLHLVKQSLAGNAAAFGRLVERHQALVCALALGVCGNLHRSEDLAQEAFVAAWRQLGELREPEKFKSWICGIVRNQANTSLRKDRHTPTTQADQECGEELPADTGTPAQHVIDNEERAILLRQLQELPVLYREPMILFYRQNESVAAVAEALDISENAVKQRLARGRVLLAERVERSLGTMLRSSGPGGTFTIAVMGAVAFIPAPASAATAGGVIAKTAANSSTSGVIAPMVALAGASGGLLNMAKGEMDGALSLNERGFVRRALVWMTAVSAVSGVILGVVMAMKPGLSLLLSVGIPITIGLLAWPLSMWIKQRRRQIRLADHINPEKFGHRVPIAPLSGTTITGMIAASGFLPAFTVSCEGLRGTLPQSTAFEFLAACAAIVLSSTAIIRHRPSRYRAVFMSHIVAIWAVTLMLGIFIRHNWINSGYSEKNQPDFHVAILMPLMSLTVMLVACAIYSFRRGKEAGIRALNVPK